jgi:hypothetical protein
VYLEPAGKSMPAFPDRLLSGKKAREGMELLVFGAGFGKIAAPNSGYFTP